jgi:hypothetical protein
MASSAFPIRRYIRGLSTPFEPISQDFLDTVAAGYAKQVARRFLDRFSGQIEEQSNGITKAIEAWETEPCRFEDTWDVAFGSIRASLDEAEPSDIVPRAVALLLRLNERGLRCCWGAKLNHPTRFRIGRTMLPASDKMQVDAVDELIEVRTRHGRSEKRMLFPRVLCTVQGGGNDLLTTSTFGERECIVLKREALDRFQLSRVNPDIDDKIPDSIGDHLSRAAEMLDAVSQQYLNWVGRSVRYVVPLKPTAGRLRSDSHFSMPGVICVSNEANVVNMVEMLIHEAAHQYMYFLRQLGPLDDGSDNNLYYSPLRGTGRPIDAILAAYHAAGNIVLFSRLVPPVKNLQLLERGAFLASLLKPMQSALYHSKALTQLGNALWRPLYNRLES